jgi:16S rRNA (cytidine1402-2'-O)-methyltransferase
MTEQGILYIVATPIGNLDDISKRAIEVLRSVHTIAAEDTRHSKPLLQKLNVSTPLIAYHDYSNVSTTEKMLKQLTSGQSIALISDAGTPLISDPGYKLVKQAREQAIDVVPVPGASALTAALSVAGLPTDRFVFEGFLPSKSGSRLNQLEDLALEPRTLVFYESPHRIVDSIADMETALGHNRQIYIGRELTKKFETHFCGSIMDCLSWLQGDHNQQKGEFVVIVAGCQLQQLEASRQQRAMELVDVLRGELSMKRAVELASDITGARKNQLYQTVLKGDLEP